MSDGRLTDAELEAIRARARASAEGYSGGEPPAMRHVRAHRDRADLLRALDAALADLAAAEGEVESLRLLVSDLASPEGDGREAQARCYRAGVEAGRAVCVGTVRTALAVQETPPSERAEVCYAADVLRSLLAALESPPTPAAARKEE